jgi:hypothetical protein
MEKNRTKKVTELWIIPITFLSIKRERVTSLDSAKSCIIVGGPRIWRSKKTGNK